MLSTIISRRRRELKLTLAELAAKVGVSEPTVQRWEKGRIKNLRHDKIVRLAKALQMHPTELMGWEQNYTFTAAANLMPLPQAAAMVPILAAENGTNNFFAIPEGIAADFCLQHHDDSMINARLFSGDIVFIRAQDAVENGAIAAVQIGAEAILRRVYYYNNRLELRAENPTYPVQNFEGAELADLRILGKAVGFFSSQIR